MKIENKEINIDSAQIKKMFEAGSHYAYSKSKRHPSVKPFIFGAKKGTEIFDLEKTAVQLEDAKNFIKKVLESNATKNALFVGSKNEIKSLLRDVAENNDLPFVTNRWVGGTLTNFEIIRKRVEKFEKLNSDKEKGDLLKYTKKERLNIDKEIERLERKFGGIVAMKELPVFVFVIDPKSEKVAVEEAKQRNIPIIALANSDCNIKEIDFPISANDSSKASVQFFLNEIVSAYKEARKTK
ncbi:MAG: 30S ribosomal protein S2 [Patescibacteria group bacterium]